MTAERSVNIKAATTTLVVHILLLLLFIFIGYSIPPSLPVEEMGIEVNLGTSLDGSGDDQPMSVDLPAAAASDTRYKAAARHTDDTKAMMQSDEPDAPVVASSTVANDTRNINAETANNARNRSQQQDANSAVNQAPQRPRYVYTGSAGRGGNNAVANHAGTNEGNTAGNGDRGVPGGTPGATNYEGSPGNGTGGISHTISGRDISPRQFVAEFNEGGKVVVRVKVDRDGNISFSDRDMSGPAALKKIAAQKLRQAKFSKNKNAPPEQIGYITFVFKTHAP